VGRSSHGAALLTDGRVLLAGGNEPGAISTAEYYDPKTSTFTVGPKVPVDLVLDHTLTIACGTGALRLTQVQREGRGPTPR